MVLRRDLSLRAGGVAMKALGASRQAPSAVDYRVSLTHLIAIG